MSNNGTQWVYELVDRITAPLNNIYKELNLVDGAAQKAEKDLHGLGNTNTGISTLTGAIGSLAVAAGGFFAISKIADWGSQIFTIGSEMEQINMNYRTMLQGNVAVSDKLVAGLKEFGKNTKFSNMEVLEAGQGLLAFGIKHDQILPKIKTIGDLSLGNSAKFKSMVDNYGKMVSAQRGNTMDINQFAIAGIPIWQELEKIIGKNGAALRKHVEENGVSIAQIDKAFENLTSRGGTFFEALKNSSNTTIAKLGNVLAGFEELAEKIFGKLQPYINTVLDFGIKYLPVFESALRSVYETIKGGVKWIEDNRDWLEALAFALGLAALGYAALNWQLFVAPIRMAIVEGVGWSLYAMTKAITAAQWLWNAAMTASPLTWIVILVAALAGVILYLWNHCEGFRVTLYAVWEASKAVFSSMVDIVIGFVDTASSLLGGLGEMLIGIFTFDPALIKTGMEDALAAISNARPLEAFSKMGEEASKAVLDGAAKGEASWLASKGAKESGESESVIAAATTGAGGTGATTNNTSGGNSSASSSSGSGTGRNISVRIDTLGQVTINAATVREGASEIRRIIHEELIGAVRDFELSISNT